MDSACCAVVVAAGSSSRMGAPKQLMELLGVPAIVWTLRAFDRAETVSSLVLVVREEDRETIGELASRFGIRKPFVFASGGSERQLSVLSGLRAVPRGTRLAAVHDGARCLVTPGEIDAAVRAALEVVGLDYGEMKDKSPFDLSGGQKRRVAIAGVIVTRPEVLVLDEPAAGLDPLGKKEVMELLHRLHREWCKTIVIVSHDMDEISENCTQAAVFSEGRVVCVLPPKELFRRADELTALGLDVPLTAKLVSALARRGVEVDCDFTTEDFVQNVLALWQAHGGKGGGA